jgi:hypothetical protein
MSRKPKFFKTEKPSQSFEKPNAQPLYHLYSFARNLHKLEYLAVVHKKQSYNLDHNTREEIEQSHKSQS